jgi:hypothetical protein
MIANLRKPTLSSQRGAAAMMIFGALMAVAGAAALLVQNNKITRYRLQQTIAKMEIDAILTSTQSGVRSALMSKNSLEGNCPSELNPANLERFRKFNIGADQVEFTIDNPTPDKFPCIIPNAYANRIEKLHVKIMEVYFDASSLSRKIEVTTDILTKGKKENTIQRKMKMVRTYQMGAMSLSRFGLIFHKNPEYAEPFVGIGASTKLRVFADTFFASQDVPTWPNLVPIASADRITYEHDNYARFSAVNATGAVSANEFRFSFRNGLQTGVLSQSFVNSFLPNTIDAKWNHKIDFFPQYRANQYAVPQAEGKATVSYCGGEAYDEGRASLAEIPSANGPAKVSETCRAVSGSDNPSFLFMNAKANLTINFNASDMNFCGMVLADTLTINIDNNDPAIYGLIGIFAVRRIILQNKQSLTGGFSEVRIYNPTDGTAPDGLAPLPGGQTLTGVGNKFRELASSTARNFFVPVNSGGFPGFTTYAPSDYLTKVCPSGAYTYESYYKPFSDLPDFPRYKDDNAGTIYFMEVQ